MKRKGERDAPTTVASNQIGQSFVSEDPLFTQSLDPSWYADSSE